MAGSVANTSGAADYGITNYGVLTNWPKQVPSSLLSLKLKFSKSPEEKKEDRI